MVDERTLPERLLDLAFYVPVGLAVSVVEELPVLAEKGRARLEGQFNVARMIGKLAVGEAQRRVGKITSETLSRPSPAAARPVAEPPAPRAEPRPAATEASTTAADASGEAASAVAETSTPDVATLAIPGYDTLAASQVVQRLSSLRPDELDAVRRYEVATRGRRTILHRIGQLSAPDGRASA